MPYGCSAVCNVVSTCIIIYLWMSDTYSAKLYHTYYCSNLSHVSKRGRRHRNCTSWDNGTHFLSSKTLIVWRSVVHIKRLFSDSRQIRFVSSVRPEKWSVCTVIYKWSDQIFVSRHHQYIHTGICGDDVGHSRPKQSLCPKLAETVLDSTHCCSVCCSPYRCWIVALSFA